MERIGLAASKMAKGNLWVYNGYVILISFLFSTFIFVVAGSTVVFALIIISYLADQVMSIESDKSWRSILTVCMVCLTVIMALFNFVALSKNLKFSKSKEL